MLQLILDNPAPEVVAICDRIANAVAPMTPVQSQYTP